MATAAELRSKLASVQASIEAKSIRLEELRTHFLKEEEVVAHGRARLDRQQAALQAATAHRSLKASLLAEKEVLIASLLQRMSQVGRLLAAILCKVSHMNGGHCCRDLLLLHWAFSAG